MTGVNYFSEDLVHAAAVAERLTGALLDRLTHHVHILEMNGESYRLAQSRKRGRREKT
jgi:DNA replication protein DnaC